MAKTAEELQVELDKVAANNKQLLKDLKTTQQKFKSFENVDLEALTKAATELEDLKAKKLEDEGEYKKLYEQQVEDHKKELAKGNDKASDLSKELAKTRKESGVAIALASVGTVPELAESAQIVLLSKAGVTDDGKVVVGDKPIDEYVKEWAKSDSGKHFIAAGDGGGGGGGSDDDDGNTKAAGYFKKGSSTWNLTEQAKIRRSDPALAETLTKQGMKTDKAE